ncbi:flagellar basal body L-ring protein FlgH [Blastomonas sp. UPD001]|jgi:flagellar L-ring protein FlgH|uniref:flagellar basal body L-ring protein FlgH n=1 Tax=Blastomonas sp. UPD001 TaxID=2217673 RepID=UPI000E34ADD5|nr:flagellar basal body L-ring protein FlgH [Blastomonas sp. UPD001]MBL0965807.1 flagellar basal body L-ring protein FlgH [Blastomonas sp.]
MTIDSTSFCPERRRGTLDNGGATSLDFARDKRAWIAVAITAALCASTPADAKKKKQPIQPDPDYAPTLSMPRPAPAVPNGAIFQASNGYSALTNGARAAMVGDVLTIALVERTQAVKSNGANTDRTGSIGLTPPTTGPLSFFNPSDVSAGGNTSFQGQGTAQQSNSLQGQITVTIAEVYPNGTMLVRGEKLMSLNRGAEHIRFSGIVRQIDIGADNVIPSSRVANAQIVYGGTGEIARASQKGWLQRFFEIISPF